MLLKEVVLVGAGNVGFHLGNRLYEKGIPVVQIFSRDLSNAQVLSHQLGCKAIDDLQKVEKRDDCLYIIAVKDDAIPSVAKDLAHLHNPKSLFVHTSGVVSSEVLTNFFNPSGVFYPLQTFSKDRQVNFNQVPICVHARDPEISEVLMQLGKKISNQVVSIDDRQRKVLHVAAVFVNNFTNHLFSIGKEIVETEKLSFELLRPLIAETAAKVQDQAPERMQTGPAIRGDQHSMLSHLQYLQAYPDYQRLYRMFSHSISQQHEQE